MLPQQLIQGYNRFSSTRFHLEQKRYHALAEEGQSPEIMIIGCCDSRVSPSIIFDTRPGEIFTARNVANLVPPYEKDKVLHHGVSASIEYGVCILKVKELVVLGHAFCGGIQSYAERSSQQKDDHFISSWLKLLAPAEQRIEGAKYLKEKDYRKFLQSLELTAIINSIENLKTFPFVKQRLEEGSLQLHGAYFSIAHGQLLVLNQDNLQFELLSIQE